MSTISPLHSTARSGVSAGRRRDLGLVVSQTGYELRGFARNRARLAFTFAFPLMFLVLFGSLNQGNHISQRGGIAYDDYFVPGILAYAVITTSFVNLAISTTFLRESGVLKRMQGAPLPRWAYLAARIASTVVIVGAMTVLTLVVGKLAYGISLRTETLGAVIVSLLLGTAAFTTLGIGLVRFIPNADAAPAIVNLSVLPLTFISGIWFVTNGMPGWLQDIAKVFPVRALADALQHAVDPRTHGAGFNAADLRTLAIWLLVGTFLMIRFLRAPAGDAG